MPTGEREWTVCSFLPDSPSAEASSGIVEIPMPPGGRRGLSLWATGTGLVAFSGSSHPEDWKTFYDDWFRRNGWQTVTAWQPSGGAWYAKYAKTDGGSVDIRFSPDDRGGQSGLLMITPPVAR
jgi:hypothetical protein